MTGRTLDFFPHPDRQVEGYGRPIQKRAGLAAIMTVAMTWIPVSSAWADDLEFSSPTSPQGSGEVARLTIFLPQGADMELGQSVVGANGYDVHAVVREWKSPGAKPSICLLRSGPYKLARLNSPSGRIVSITLVIPDQNGPHIASFKYSKDYPSAAPVGFGVRMVSDALIGGPGTHQELKARVTFLNGKKASPFASSADADAVYNGVVPDSVIVSEALAPNGTKEC